MTFDEVYGAGSLAALQQELSTPELPATRLRDWEELGVRHLRIEMEGSAGTALILLEFTDKKTWVYTRFNIDPPQEGIYTGLCDVVPPAATKRGVTRFETRTLTPEAAATLETSGWTLASDEDHASVAPSVPEAWAQSVVEEPPVD